MTQDSLPTLGSTVPFPEAVCHRTLTGDLAFYPRAEYQGRTIYFCTEYCQRAFLQDPRRFLPAHSMVRGLADRCEFNPEGMK